MKTLIAISTLPFLGGCFFFYIPGSAMNSISDSLGGYEGQHCVGENVPVGTKIRLTSGTTGTVTKLEGTSSRCQEPGRPIRAVVTLDSAPTALGPDSPVQ